MIRKPLKFVYGIRLVATWMLIPFVLMFVPMLAKEFSAKMTTQEVILKEETYSGYPDVYRAFKTDINGKERVVQAPVTSTEGDRITVILRNGEYLLTPDDSKTMNDYMTFTGRFLRVCNNNFGLHVIGITAVLVISFLITFIKRKDIRQELPTLSKVTDIAGLIISVIMSAVLVYAVIDNSLTSLGIAYLCLFLGMIYTGVFILVWAVVSAIPK